MQGTPPPVDDLLRWLIRAEAARKAGREPESVRYLQRALGIDPERTIGYCLQHADPGLRQNYMLAAAAACGSPRPRPFYLLREDALLGRFRPALTAPQRETLRFVFDLHQKRWDRGETPLPPERDVYREGRAAVVPSSLRVALVWCGYIFCGDVNPATQRMECENPPHIRNSARAAGLGEVDFFAADGINQHGSATVGEELVKLTRFLAEKRPSLVVIDGNYLPTERTIRPEIWLRLKQKYGFRIMAIFGDCYDGNNGGKALSVWGPVSDLSVIFHRYGTAYESFPSPDKVLICPPTPYDEELLASTGAPRDIGLGYIGGVHRERGLFMDVAKHSGIPTYAHLHQREKNKALDLAGYADILRRSKMFFNNGYRDPGDDILTAHIPEAIMAGSLLIQEVGSPIDEYLVPFVHYVPVSNLHQFVATVQFLCEDEPRRAALADQAYRFWKEHYSTTLFWRTAIARLFPAS